MSTAPKFHGLNDDDTATHRTVTDSGVFDAVMDEAAAEIAQGTTRTIRRTESEPRQVCVPSLWRTFLALVAMAWEHAYHYVVAFLLGILTGCVGALLLLAGSHVWWWFKVG